MNAMRFLSATLLITLAAPAGPAHAGDAPRPNIVVILSDDMGFSDIGCYGGEAQTPTLDRLAAHGVRFTQFYNTGRCCPTRAALLTGLYPHQAGIGHMMNETGEPGYTGNLNDRCVTIAQALRPAGYATYMTGKWHVTRQAQVSSDDEKFNWPLQRGFDRFYGTIHGAGSFYDPNSLTDGNTYVTPDGDDWFYTDAIADRAATYVREHDKQQGDKPFFLYVAFTAAHWPMHARPETIAKYKGRFDAGYGALRDARLERVRKLGLIDERWTMTDQAAKWRPDSPDHAWELRGMEVYAAMIDEMDAGIGRIVASLEETGQLDNTLILYMQDNGGCAEGLGRNDGERFNTDHADQIVPMKPGELQTQMIPKRTRDGKPVRLGTGVMPGPADTYIAYGEGWANVSNTPFREYKHWVHEGGIATPLIAHWPAGIARRNAVEHQPGHLIDVMATCIDLAGAEYPDRFNGHAIRPMEGVSLRSAFDGKPLERAEPIYFEHEGNRAIRAGRWKLVAKGADGPWELYDMDADRTETRDLASEQPAKAKELAAQWQAWAERADVLPLTPWRNRSRERVTFSNKAKFELEPGAALDRASAPHLNGRPLTVTVRVTEPGDNGVLVAQGGSAEGWALYVKDGVLTFATRRGGRFAKVEAPGGLGNGVSMITATLDDDGALTLARDNEPLASAKQIGPLSAMPLDGLEVGRDLQGAVGEYAVPFDFTGKLKNVLIELDP